MFLRPDHIPAKPGVYLFKGPKERVLYVGKAKNLKKRLQSYFRDPARMDARKSALMKEVRDVSYLVTANELEAFVLEANLIKQNRPRFNVVLRDDKNYPYLKLTIHEEWPRLEVVRKVRKDGALYFGPYVPAGTMWEMLSFIRRNFHIRDCAHHFEKRMRPCVQYQMNRCPAPCAGLVDRGDYLRRIEEVRLFLLGERKDLIGSLRKEMERLSESQRYEEAGKTRDRIRAIEQAWESQKAVDPSLGDIDVVGYSPSGNDAVFQVFFIRNGIMIGSQEFFLRYAADIPVRELMQEFLARFYTGEGLPAPEIIVPVQPEEGKSLKAWLKTKRAGSVRILVPKTGRKRELLEMATENAMIACRNRRQEDPALVLHELKERLKIEESIATIGACDISNISGSEAVGAFVYWAGGEFRKDRYRRLRIKTVAGIDDYAMMREALERLFENLAGSFPDLLIIDGGRGHLETARKIFDRLPAGSEKNPVLIGLAKDPDRAFLLNAVLPLDLEDRRKSSLLLRRIRDEAHRFAIGYHRTLRGREFFQSPLERIPGIGKKRRLELLRVFGSIEEIRAASIDEIAVLKGFNKGIAESLLHALRRIE
ncbi:MAG: excinuclease ABC subunit UvrC [Nitrospirota bacterium]